jgi:hypothetical protein
MFFLMGSDFGDGLVSGRLMVRLGLLAMLLMGTVGVVLGSFRNLGDTGRVGRGKAMMLYSSTCNLGGSMV